MGGAGHGDVGVRGSGDDVADEIATVDDFDGAVAWGHEFLVGDDAELVVDGGHDVFDGDRVEVGFGGGGVGAAEDVAFGDAAACEHGGEDASEVVAAGGAVDFGGAAEFGGDEDECAVEEPLFVEVRDERARALSRGGSCFLILSAMPEWWSQPS